MYLALQGARQHIGLLPLETTARSKTAPYNVRVVSAHVLWSCGEPPGPKGVRVSSRRRPMATFMVPSVLSTRKPPTILRPSYKADSHARTFGTTGEVLRHNVFELHVPLRAPVQLDVALQTVHRHVHAPPPSAGGV